MISCVYSDLQKFNRRLNDRISTIEKKYAADVASLKDDIHNMNALPDGHSMSEWVELLQCGATANRALIEGLHEEVASLKATIAQFEEASVKSIDEPNEYIKHFEITPVYDYVLIKARRRVMHQEYHTAFKFFSRLLRIRYDMPIAIAVK
jgi:N-formylglutamate amidohydrolase